MTSRMLLNPILRRVVTVSQETKGVLSSNVRSLTTLLQSNSNVEEFAPSKSLKLSLSHQRTRVAYFGSDSITYSGGQATEGQGGYYGSGGARATGKVEEDDDSSAAFRKKMITLAQNVELIRNTMVELEKLENQLRDTVDDPTSKESIEVKHAIKKLMTAPDVIESLNNLEINGEPLWGLSTDERELIILAREKVNEC